MGCGKMTTQDMKELLNEMGAELLSKDDFNKIIDGIKNEKQINKRQVLLKR